MNRTTNTSIPDDQFSGIKEALFRGQKIQAIKLYRKSTASGLAEAKNAVEKLEAELRSQFPEKFIAKPAAGCLGVAAVICTITGLLVLLWLGK